MRPRLEVLLLVLATGAAAAFVVSFALGWSPGARAAAGTIGSRSGPSVPADSVHVEVLNASGRTGLARTATERLRSDGFDVVYFGNAAAVQEQSAVFDRVGRPEFAKAVAASLGISAVRTVLDSTRVVEVSVVIGRSWQPED